MAATKQPTKTSKIEARSRTGASFRRAGLTWSTAWTEVPADVLSDKSRMKLLEDDRSIEFRIDGKRIPRFEGDPGDPESTRDAGDNEALRTSFRELEESHAQLNESHAKMRERHEGEVKDLTDRIAQLEAAALKASNSVPTYGTSGQSPAAPTISSDGHSASPLAASTTANEPTKTSAKK